MKPIALFYCFLFIFSFFSSLGQEHTLKLKMEEGHEYVFEKIDKDSSIKKDGAKVQNSESKLVFRLVVEKVVPDSITTLTLNYSESIYDRSIDGGLINTTDVFFPSFNKHVSRSVSRNLIPPVLNALKFRFSVRLKTGEITFENRAEILEDTHARLKEKKYSDDEIKSKIKYLNERILNKQTEQIEFLTWFLNTKYAAGDTLKSKGLNERFTLTEQKGKFISLGEQDFSKIKPGKIGKKFWINTDNGLITNYSTLKVDSVRSRTEKILHDNVLRAFETDFSLLYSQAVPVKKLFIKGQIENPLSDEIHIRYLDESFGNTLKTKTILLNADNSFNTVIDFKHSSFVYVENENKNKHNSPGTFVFYAESGDTISFNSTGSELPWETVYSGSNPVASKMLHNIRSTIKLPEGGYSRGGTNLIFDQNRLYGVTVVRMGGLNRSERSSIIPEIFNLLNESVELIEPYKSLVSERAFSFISNETKAYFYNALYDNAQLDLSQFGWNGTKVILRPEEYSPELVRVDQLDIHEIYNDYGWHSRLCVSSYVNYNFIRSNKISQRFISPMGYLSSEIDLRTQFSRMVLTGSPLYRELGNSYQSIVSKKKSKFERINQSPLQESAIDGLEMIIQLCNDSEMVNKAKRIVNQYNKLEDENYIPPLKMLDINGSPVTYKDIAKGKPTIFCISSNWIGQRYELDQQALKNSDLKFVFVVEGTSLEQWQQYSERAVPDAEQLLFNNEKQSLNNIFHDTEVFLIFGNDGEFIKYGSGIKNSITIAKEALEPKKKELNKSQLQIIVIVLGVGLVLLTLGFIGWKWRIRQRFRKEEQIRKLRELELTAIRSQMNPHFLFNALNSVQNLVQQNKGREAHLYLADFAGLIRKVLNNSEKEEVSLAEELEMTEQYLNLEKLRFEFEFVLSVAEEIDSHNTLVPSMLLQPFVENAVIHGLQSKAGDKQLKIEISKVELGINISIEDNGIGRTAAKEIAKAKNGKGTKLIKERLEILQEKQGEKYSLQIVDLEIGTRVDIVIPEES